MSTTFYPFPHWREGALRVVEEHLKTKGLVYRRDVAAHNLGGRPGPVCTDFLVRMFEGGLHLIVNCGRLGRKPGVDTSAIKLIAGPWQEVYINDRTAPAEIRAKLDDVIAYNQRCGLARMQEFAREAKAVAAAENKAVNP